MNTRLAQFVMIIGFMLAQFVMTFGLSVSTQANSLSETERAAYTLPDGSLPILCLTLDEGGVAGDHGCDGCLCCAFDCAQLSTSFVLESGHAFLVDRFPTSQRLSKDSPTTRSRAPPMAA